MVLPAQRPWAILLCRFQDDTNDPSTTTLSELYGQWIAKFGPAWVANNLDSAAATDPRTILELYNEFFASPGVITYNSVRYWSEMSHGSIDVSGSIVFPCKLWA